MAFNFGDNLRTLRKQRGLTQEQLAELLDVSKQSVSRWENSSTWPDIMFLPVLASFYGVTVDSLLGADYETNKRMIEEYEKEREEAHHRGDLSTAYALSQRLYAAFPNHNTVIDHMMHDAYLMGLYREDGERKHYLELSVSVAERFLKMTEDVEEQCRCISHIAVCSKLLGKREAAVRWLMKLPGSWSAIERTALDILEGQERIDSVQCSLDLFLQMVCQMLRVYVEDANLTDGQRIGILEKIPRILELFFEEGDYGYYHLLLSRTYAELAKCCIGDGQKREGYAGKALEHARMYDALSEGIHTSLLMRGHGITPAAYTNAGQKTQLQAVEAELADIL